MMFEANGTGFEPQSEYQLWDAVYRYGIELWKFPETRTSHHQSIPSSFNNGNLQPEQMIIIAALDKSDYENLLNDLYQALCETNLVALELK
ncbi:unnamed protein product [Schistosoma mattheei]|uniref:Uncharacterized protein n=1 Tax=Schistosoma mattheei TaxID=31246 RepID=A0A183Q7T3_9TREM|nr:unnamed protein product [Schistosoma mattheei]